MANNRDQQEVLLVPVTATANGQDFHEVMLVLGPAMTISNPAGTTNNSQLWIIT